ncbi:S8 family peptidase [Actinomadura sp. HBU206391]|nr:S8 family peptidase [Actinomadura sp. HBU206391]
MRRGVAIGATAALALMWAGPAQAADGTIRSADGAEFVPGSFIVVLKDGSASRSAVGSNARSLTARHGGAVTQTFGSALRGFAVTSTDAQARRLAGDTRVAFVQRNLIHRATATQPNPPSWGLDRIDQRNLPLNQAYDYATTAAGVRAYVIDTGIRTTHSDFGGRASIGYDAVGDGQNGQDCNGHGTHVAGTVGGTGFGVAKGVDLVGVRVLNCQGSGTTAQVAAGIDWVTANAQKPAVANMSLGGGADTALDNAVVRSIGSGVSYAIAAGNGFLGLFPQNACSTSPARVPAAITVSVTNNTDTKASWGNYGTCVDLFAPGINITSAWNTNDTATNTISGTSMSTPHVAGAAALYLAGHPNATPQEVRDAIVNNATNGVVKSPGSGSPNKLLYTSGL